MQPENTEPKFIDVEKVIGDKNPNLLKILPRFIIRYLKRILHQEKLNGIIYRNRDKQGIDFLDAVLQEFNVQLKVIGEHHLSENKSFVVISNHPLGGLDGIALMHTIGRINPAISMTANDFLMHIQNLRSLFVPVNKHGSNADNIEALNKTFEAGKNVIFFPAGLCSRKVGNQIIDLDWKKTFLSQARKHNRHILPVHISGRNSSFFYNLARFRKKIGLKANIEMLYLVDEMFKQENQDIVITFGKPIPVDLFDKRLKDKDWASRLRSYVYKLEKDANAEFSLTDY